MAEIEKVDLTSVDIKEHQIEKLKELFPEAFKALKEIKEPGAIIDLPYRWRREKYEI